MLKISDYFSDQVRKCSFIQEIILIHKKRHYVMINVMQIKCKVMTCKVMTCKVTAYMVVMR